MQPDMSCLKTASWRIVHSSNQQLPNILLHQLPTEGHSYQNLSLELALNFILGFKDIFVFTFIYFMEFEGQKLMQILLTRISAFKNKDIFQQVSLDKRMGSAEIMCT